MLRQIPEERIKMLRLYRHHHEHWAIDEESVRKEMVRDMGIEIAQKLFEFNKVLIQQRETSLTYIAELEVIVPKGAPEMSKTPTEPLHKITLNLFASDVEWFKDRYGQGWSEVLRLTIRKHVQDSKTEPFKHRWD